MKYPSMLRIRQRFEALKVKDVAAEVRRTLSESGVLSRIGPEETVAITAGSRGISNINPIMKAIVDTLREAGGQPFIVPAMGSHGGGTAEGQREVLRHYGITEADMGVPIRSSMEVVHLGETPNGFPVYLDRWASEADHIAVVNRVKPHTEFSGATESGLLKMITIGLGKCEGAAIYHQVAVQHAAIDQIAQAVAQMVIEKRSILFGLGIVENGYDQTAHIEASGPEGIVELDQRLLRLAKRLMPRLPFDELDLLIVDEMGKNISGSGMDTNVIGRKSWAFQFDPNEKPHITRIFVRDLTDQSEGNACGLGLADFTLRRLVDKIDMHASYLNAITSTRPRGVMIPMTFDNDRKAIEAALSTTGVRNVSEAKVVRIKNTLHMENIDISEALLPEIQGRHELTILTSPKEMTFDRDGYLTTELGD